MPSVEMQTVQQTRRRAAARQTNWPLLLVIAGVLLRLAAVAFMDTQQDGNAYATMGHSLAATGTLQMPWGDGYGGGTSASPSHHYPPLYPGYLAAFYHFLGWTPNITKLANLILSLATVAIVFLATRSLYGKTVAWFVAGLVSVLPRFIMATGTGFSENMVAIVFTLTLWAGLKGLKEPAYLILAGLFAGFSFLTRSGMGPFFFVGIAAGLAWRIRYAGAAGTFTNKSYLMGGFLFVVLAGTWSLRNLDLFGDWQSSSYLSMVTSLSLQMPGYLALGVLFKAAQYILVLALFYQCFKPEWLASWREKRAEADSLVWLSIGLIVGLGAVISGMIWSVERSPPFWMDSERYLAMAYVPLLWLLMRKYGETKPKSFRIRYVALAGVFLLVNVYELAEPTRSPEIAAAQALAGKLKPGDTIGVIDQEQGLGRYSFYPYLPVHDGVKLTLCSVNATNPCAGRPDFIMGIHQIQVPGYNLTHEDRIDFFPIGHGKTVYTYWRTT